jgi:endonuclease YncB( thermonuclease family)
MRGNPCRDLKSAALVRSSRSLRGAFQRKPLWFAGLLLALLITATQVNAEPRAAAGACPHDSLGTGEVDAVLDGRTVVLTDGRQVRLVGIEAPQGEAGLAARAALRALVAGVQVTLMGPTSSDRYGRLVAELAVPQDGSERSVGLRLLADGLALVAPATDARCATENLVAERSARRAKLGLWADPYYDILSADSPGAVAARRGHFTLVEGKVVSVRESSGTIYLNFGRRWSEDFTVTVQKRSERAFVDAGIEPKKLEGRRVRVRGWIEVHGGPWIEALRPTQIEIVDGN